MLFLEDLTEEQFEGLRQAFFEEIDNEYDSAGEVPDAIVEEHYRHMTFAPEDFEPGGAYCAN